jgi:hypothetical protein
MRRILSRIADFLTVERLGMLLGALGIAILLIGNVVDSGGFSLRRLFDDLYSNIGTDLLSIALTVLLIDKLVERRDIRDQKARLIREMGSRDNGTALRAVDELRAHGWLHDGSLVHADLKYGNLTDANLADADLREAYLSFATLHRADLRGAKLNAAILRQADLREALLLNADLGDAKLLDANLANAKMQGASLKGAVLGGANLSGARGLSDERLAEASKLQKALMPTGIRYDGRFNLPGDVAGMDTSNIAALAAYYEITPEAYQRGQARK